MSNIKDNPMRQSVEQVMQQLQEAIKRNGGRARHPEPEKPPSALQIARALESDGFPKRHLSLAARLVESGWLESIRRRLIEQLSLGETVLLHGPTGAAKTLLACVVAIELSQRQKRVTYATMPDLLLELRDCFDRRQSINDTLSRYETGILMLDELVRWKGSEWEQNVLWILLDRRWRSCKGTLLIAEGGRETLNELLPAAGRRRILESGGTIGLTKGSLSAAGLKLGTRTADSHE